MLLVSRERQLDLRTPCVMGILNVTPDSFFDGGSYQQLDQALYHVADMVSAGAQIIDVGGESTRPGALPVSSDAELARVIPVIEALARRFDVWISIDTSKPQVMAAAAVAGAHLINDIYALRMPGALDAAIATELPVCLMHMQGSPLTMQEDPTYSDVVESVYDFFNRRIDCCMAAGLTRDRLILDPGFGFGKYIEHNYRLLAHLSVFHTLQCPILIGVSRKAMLGGQLHERLMTGVAAATIAALHGARILRVHDVAETVAAMRIVSDVIANLIGDKASYGT